MTSFDISDYKILKSDRKKKKSARKNSGGILMIYKETFEEGITKMHSSDKHFIWIKLDHSFFIFQMTFTYVELIFHQQTQPTLRMKMT